MKNRRWVIGSRPSKLALVQAQQVKDKLKALYPAIDLEIKTIKTAGDKILDAALDKIKIKDFFTKEIDGALSRGEIDLAVHSMKDLPAKPPLDLKIIAVTEREDPRDVLISRGGFTIEGLPKNSKVGTSSLRRRVQLLHIRNDLILADLRGNLDTRVKKLEQGLYDGIVVAYAGIKRLGLRLKLSLIPIEDILPQAGQGALGIEIRKVSQETADLVKALDNLDSHLSIDAERALLSGLEAGCLAPVGVYAYVQNNQLTLKTGIFSWDGRIAIKDEINGPKEAAESLGQSLAKRLLKKSSVRKILDEARKAAR